MSTVTYRHEVNHSYKKKGIKYTIKKKIVDGEKGLSITYLKKEGDDDSIFHRIAIEEKDKDKFSVKEKKGEKETDKIMSLSDLLEFVKGNTNLNFSVQYMEKERGTYNSINKKTRSVKKQKGGAINSKVHEGEHEGEHEGKPDGVHEGKPEGVHKGKPEGVHEGELDGGMIGGTMKASKKAVKKVSKKGMKDSMKDSMKYSKKGMKYSKKGKSMNAITGEGEGEGDGDDE